MNSNPFKKRNNPMDVSTPAQQPTPQPQPVAKPAPVQRKVAPVVVNEDVRVKYTATMDKNTRRRLKFAAAKRDIQISQFIEEAVLEKMEREGD